MCSCQPQSWHIRHRRAPFAHESRVTFSIDWLKHLGAWSDLVCTHARAYVRAIRFECTNMHIHAHTYMYVHMNALYTHLYMYWNAFKAECVHRYVLCSKYKHAFMCSCVIVYTYNGLYSACKHAFPAYTHTHTYAYIHTDVY